MSKSKEKKVGRAKRLRIHVSEVRRIHLSASRVSVAILQGLNRKVTEKSFGDLFDIIKPYLDNSDQLSQLALQKLLGCRPTKDGKYLIMPEEKGEWSSNESDPPFRNIRMEDALDTLQPTICSILCAMEQFVFDDEEEGNLGPVTDEAFEAELAFLLENAKSNTVYF